LSTYALIESTSPDTALRDITDLVERGPLKKDAGGGRSTSYSLVVAQLDGQPAIRTPS
jgi:Fic family protein